MVLGMTLPVFGGVLAGGIVVLLLLTMVIGRLRNRGYDLDDDEDDEDDEDDDEDDFFSSFQSKPMPSRSTPAPRSQPSSGGPSGGPPPSRAPSSGPPSRAGPPGKAQPARSSNPALRTLVSKADEPEPSEVSSPQKKVRRARIEVDMSLFEDWQADDRDAAVEWVVAELGEGEQERTLLMQLQGTGWSAQQSRAIYDMARNQQ